MTDDRDIASRTLVKLAALADDEIEMWDVAQALQLIERAVADGRREGEISGFTRGIKYACDAHAFALERCLLKPISAAEVTKAEEEPS